MGTPAFALHTERVMGSERLSDCIVTLNVQFVKLNQGMSANVVSAIQFCTAHHRLVLSSLETQQTVSSPVLAVMHNTKQAGSLS